MVQADVRDLLSIQRAVLTSSLSFIQAPNSRDKLNITREMLAFVLTYHQIMPDFLDFIFSFGKRKQARAQDFHFTAFRQRTRLHKNPQGLQIRELGWSGRDFQMCYNLKAVEYSSSQPQRPWSIRHCAVSHSFDVETGRTTWVMVKGNKLMQQRLVQATSHRGLPELHKFGTVHEAFTASLSVHQMLCNWLAEDWRWYINFLEEKYQDISRRTIANEISVPPLSPHMRIDDIPKPQRTETSQSEKSVLSKFSKTRTQTFKTLASIKEKSEATFDNVFTHLDTGLSQPLPPGVKAEGDELPEKDAVQYDDYGQQEFSFRDLQELHFIDVKAGEAALVLKHDLNIILQLLQYYQFIFKLTDFPEAVRTDGASDFAHFEMHLKGIEMDLQNQVSRIEALQRSVSDCKTLVN